LAHPRYKVDKKYLVKCEGFISDEQMEKLRNGIELDDGMTSPAQVELISRSKNSGRFHIIIHEGRKRQIRRMCQALGLSVVILHRVKYGSIELSSLKAGAYRLLRQKEVEKLKSLVGI
ncbi:MAG: pseudouridine synthase, partial [candidate division Zixibacteria bacterium]